MATGTGKTVIFSQLPEVLRDVHYREDASPGP